MENGKIKCNLCNEEYSADACKSFTYGRLDVNICPNREIEKLPITASIA